MKKPAAQTEQPTTTAFINARLIDPASGRDEQGGLVVRGNEIADLGGHLRRNAPDGATVVDCEGHVLAPGRKPALILTLAQQHSQVIRVSRGFPAARAVSNSTHARHRLAAET